MDPADQRVRELILDAAAASFLKPGLPESSMSDIIEAAGVAPEIDIS